MRRLVLLVPFLLFNVTVTYAEQSISQKDANRIVAAAQRVAQAPSDSWTFAVISETATKRFVQFSKDEGESIFDFPILRVRRPNNATRSKDADCSTKPPRPEPGEVEKRFLSEE